MPRLVTAIVVAVSAFAFGCSVEANAPSSTEKGPKTEENNSVTITTPPSAAAAPHHGPAAVGSVVSSVLIAEESVEYVDLGTQHHAAKGTVFRAVKVTLTNNDSFALPISREMFSLRSGRGVSTAMLNVVGDVVANQCADDANVPSGGTMTCSLLFNLGQQEDVSVVYALPNGAGHLESTVPQAAPCTMATPLSREPVKVRVSTDASYPLEGADVPNGLWVLHHSELYTDRPRADFTTPASTVVIRQGEFQEVEVGDVVLRKYGQLENGIGGNAKLSCVAPILTHRTTDSVSYEKHGVGELVLERHLENEEGVLRRYYRKAD